MRVNTFSYPGDYSPWHIACWNSFQESWEASGGWSLEDWSKMKSAVLVSGVWKISADWLDWDPKNPQTSSPTSLSANCPPNRPHRPEPRIFEWGFKRNRPKSWQWKQKQWKPIKGRSPAKNGSKVPNRVTTLNPYKSGLEWTFEALPVPKIISWESSSCRKRTQVNCTSGGRAMAVQRGQPSVEFLQNWWKTLICVQTLVSQAWSGVLQKFKNLEPSEWSALAMEQAPRTVAPLEGKLQPDRVGKHHRIFTNFALKWPYLGPEIDFFRNSKG